MSACDVLVLAGTHGNEVNAPWLLDQWNSNPNLINAEKLDVQKEIGNPAARAAKLRYIDRDLNRCFRKDLLESKDFSLEVVRARELLAINGPEGERPCQVAIDLHSTTASMGNCLVIYGRRNADLALAALVQGALGLPVYLHECDSSQTGFLVASWPCGVVIEVGPVPQSLLDERIVCQTRLALEACLAGLSSVREGRGHYPRELLVHRHLGSLDFPRGKNGLPKALLHPEILGKDWHELDPSKPIYKCAFGEDLIVDFEKNVSAVFVNEAAYAEKRIALSLTKREVWPLQRVWQDALEKIMV